MKRHGMVFSALGVLLIWTSASTGEIMGTDSIEWMTADCKLVVRGRVAKEEKEAGEGSQIYEDVTAAVSEVIKGEYKAGSVTFRWMTYKGHKTAESWRKSGHEILFFLKKGDPSIERGRYRNRWTLRTRRTGWVDLDDPGNSAIAASFKVIKTKQEILDIVRKRAALLKRKPPAVRADRVGIEPNVFTPQKGVIRLDVPFGSEAFRVLYGGSSCFLMVPADPKYKDWALKLCKSRSAWDRARGADALVNYPGDDTIKLLKSFLKDEEASFWTDSTGKVVKVDYRVRGAAYNSLIAMGKRVEKPVLERKPTQKEAVSELVKMAKRYIDEKILNRKGGSADWQLDVHLEDAKWVVEIPDQITQKMHGDCPKRLLIDTKTKRISTRR